MPLHENSASQIVVALEHGQVSASEVVRYQRERIEALNPQINAIVSLNTALIPPKTEALAGLPITVKDQIHVHGMTCTFGSEQYKNFQPSKTAPVVERLLNAGAYVIGKTNLPPFAMDFQCSNTVFGTTNNPWNLDYTPGGSSGGGAAAVAAGLSFLDIGTDLSGSLRIPASFCGVFSLVPTENALPNEGMMAGTAPALKHFARMGPIARTAEDLELAWTHMCGGTDEKHTDFVMPDVHWSLDGGQIEVCDSIRHTFQKAAITWAETGITVSQKHAETFSFQRARRAFGEIMGFETGALMPAPIRFLARLSGRESARRSPEFIAHILQGYRRNRAQYEAALETKQALSACIDAFLGDNSVWILPVTATSVFKHMTPTMDRNGVRDYAQPLYINGQPVNYFDAISAFTAPISLTGHPVVTLPLGLDKNGLPIGAQLIGAKGCEHALIKTAGVLHAALMPANCPMLMHHN